MKKAELGDHFIWKGQIVKVIGINQGHKSIMFEVNQLVCCERCGHNNIIPIVQDIIEHSLLFQDNAMPVQTISDK